jgi:hypothetical protein
MGGHEAIVFLSICYRKAVLLELPEARLLLKAMSDSLEKA